MVATAMIDKANSAVPPSGKGRVKKAVEVEKILHWAYLDELPKRRLSSAEGIWDRLEKYGFVGGENPDRSGGAQRYAQFGLPHDDAIEIERAVDALGSVSIDGDFDVIVGELAALVTVNDLRPRSSIKIEGTATVAGYYDADGAPPQVRSRDTLLVRSFNVSALVAKHAVMRTRPIWTSDQPRPRPVPATHGRGNTVVGECRGKNLYTTGAHCPVRWWPSPIEAVLGRAVYHVWYHALVTLADSLELIDHDVLPPEASAAPWLIPDQPNRVFAFARMPQKRLPLKPSREVALPPLRPDIARKRRNRLDKKGGNPLKANYSDEL